MAIQLGPAYLPIVPSFKGGKKAIVAEFGGQGVPVGKQLGSGASVGFGAVFKGVLASTAVTSVIKGIGGVVSGAFQGGFDRVMNIQNAEIKLATLAKSAGLVGQAVDDSVKASMASVSDAVDGTKFAISDAADMASQLGAAGVASGKDMTRWLSLTADAAQFSNREFGDMQRVIGKVVAEGRVTGETFQELPLAAAALSKSLGIPQAEVRKLASEGKISAAQFADAMDSMIGGAAKDAGASFMSLRDNIKSALNASMAAFVKPVTDAMMPIMGAGLDLVKGFRDDVAKPLGASFGEFLQPKAEALAGAMKNIPAALDGAKGMLAASGISDWLGSLADLARGVFDGVKDAIGGFVDGFGGMGDLGATFGPILSMLMGPLGILKTALADVFTGLDWGAIGKTAGGALRPIVDAVVDLSAILSGTLADVLADLMPMLGDIATSLLPVLADGFRGLVSFVGGLASAIAPLVAQLLQGLVPVLMDLIRQVLPPVLGLIEQLSPVVLAVSAAVVPLVTQLAGALIPIITTVVSAIAPLITQLVDGLAPIITDVVQTVLPPLMDAFQAVADLLQTVIVPAFALVVGYIASELSGTISALMPVVQTVFQFIGDTIKNAMNAISGVIKVVTSVIKGDWSGAWNGIKSIASAVWGQIKNIVDTAINLVKGVIDGVMTKVKLAWDGAWKGVKDAGKLAWDWISGTAGKVFGDMKTSITKTFDDMKTGLGKIWDGIKAVFAKPINAVIRFINDGIIGGYNSVASAFKMTKLSKLGLLPGYDTGGFTGPGHRLKPAGIVHAGEYVLTQEEVRRMGGPRGVEAWKTHDLPGYAGGGLVTYQGKTFTALFASLLRRANEMAGGGMHISQGGFRPRTSYSGTSHQGDAVDITGSYRKFIAPLRSVGIPTWDRAGKGKWVDHAHGVPLPGSGRAAGSAVWQAQDYLRGGDGLGGRDNGPRGNGIMGALKGLAEAFAAGFNSVKEWFSGILDKVTEPFKALTSGAGGGAMGGLVLGVGEKLKDDLTGWVKDKLGVGYAGGTSSARRGLAWVGEQGPELVAFRGGEQVFPASQSASAAGGLRVGTINLQLPAWVKDFDDTMRFLASFDFEVHAT